MNKTKVMGYVDQAAASVEQQLSKIRVRLGEIPEVNMGEVVGREVDKLRQQGVPVTGYVSSMSMALSHPQKDNCSVKIPLKETVLLVDKLAILQQAIRDFEAEHNVKPRQKLLYSVSFNFDQSQITEN